MSRLVTGLLLGGAAGLVDTTPMMMRGVELSQVAQAFAHWVATGILISYTSMPLPAWGRGVAVSLLTALPILVERGSAAPSSMVGVIAMSIALGAVVGFASAKLSKG